MVFEEKIIGPVIHTNFRAAEEFDQQAVGRQEEKEGQKNTGRAVTIAVDQESRSEDQPLQSSENEENPI